MLNTETEPLTVVELLSEFTEVYNSPPTAFTEEVEAIVILSADGNPESETISRIKHGIECFHQVPNRPLIIFSGVTEEQNWVIGQLKTAGAPNEVIRFQDCGSRQVANTKTQFEKMAQDPLTRYLRKLIIVTSSYHIPRTIRTAGKYLHPETTFHLSADPSDWTLNNTFLKVSGEIRRIMTYSKKGDILARPR